MNPRLMLFLVFATPLALAADPKQSLPSVESFFSQAALDRYCNPGSATASPALEAYRSHTIEYFKGGALASPKSVQEGASAAVQSLKGDVPSSYVEELNKAIAATSPAALKSVCANLELIIKDQIAIESLSIRMIQAGQSSE